MIDLVGRRTFFDHYIEQIEGPTALPPSLRRYHVRYACPCCGYPTLGDRGMDEICYLCSWEDDGQDESLSLSRAREKFATYEVMYEREQESVIQREVIAAFEEMRRTPFADHERLWSIVYAGSRQLYAYLVESMHDSTGQ